MREMSKLGASQKKIGLIFGVSQSTAGYHISDEQKERILKRVIKTKYVWAGRKEYMKKYMRERYNSDPEFKAKIQKANRENQRRKYGESKQMGIS